MRIYDVADMLESYAKTNSGGYRLTALAKAVGEPPSTVYDALKKVCEPRGTMVYDEFVHGWCHTDHHTALREEKERIADFRRISTTQVEDELAYKVKKHTSKAERILSKGLVGRLYRHFFRGTPGWETEESAFRTLLNAYAHVVDEVQGGDSHRQAVQRAYETYDRWRKKPRG